MLLQVTGPVDQVASPGFPLDTAEIWRFSVAIGLTIVTVWFVRFFIRRIVKSLTGKTKTTLDDYLLAALQAPVSILVVLIGLYFSVIQIKELAPYQKDVFRAFSVAQTFVVVFTVSRVVGALLNWYGHEVAARTSSSLDDKLLPVLRRIATVVIWVVGGLLILDRAGQPISPLLASLGIGGLAVALAFQPTLANFFAGTYILSDAIVKHGDFIEMQDGVTGTVQEIGWRVTQILTQQNNLVIVPNSRLADAIITDYSAPDPEMNLWLNVGVSYESDLAQVERVALEVARDVSARSEHLVSTAAPLVLFREFGDSNVVFRLVVRARSRQASLEAQSELVKALHARFQKEGIVFNYPARTLYWAPGHEPKAFYNPAPDLAPPAVQGRVAPANVQAPRRPGAGTDGE